SLTLKTVFYRQSELWDTFFDVPKAVEFIGAPVQPHATGRNPAAPGDESALIFRPVFQILNPVAFEFVGYLSEFITDGIGALVQPPATGRNPAAPGDDSALIFRPVFQIITPVAFEFGGYLSECITEGIGEQVQTRQIRAVRFSCDDQYQVAFWSGIHAYHFNAIYSGTQL